MTRLGLRLTLASGRDAAVRLVAIAAAVGIGVALLLTTLAGIHAVHAQAARTAWLTTSKQNARPSVDEATVEPLWAETGFDQYGAAEIERIDLAPTGPRSPAAPGVPHPDRMQLILAVVAGVLLIPVLLFIAAASRLAAARREQRFAAMRLVGATPGQVSVVAAVEASVAAVLGVAAGFVLFFALRPLLATVPFTGEPFFHNDLSLRSRDVLLVAIGVPIPAVAAARLSLRRVQISPLGVTRQAARPDPTAWRVIPLVAGLAELAYFVGRRPATAGGQIRAHGAGFLRGRVGLVV